MVTYDQVLKLCMSNFGTTRVGTGSVELYDEHERRRRAFINLGMNLPRWTKLGSKFDKFRRRVERRVLAMQENLRFLMEKKDTREEWRVNNVDELFKALEEGYSLSSEEFHNRFTNPCAEIKIGPIQQTNLWPEPIYHTIGSPYGKSLSSAQQRLIARAVWRHLNLAHGDSVVVEALPHMKISQTLMQKLRNDVAGGPATELLYAFYNQHRQPQWWAQYRAYGTGLSDQTNRQIYAMMVTRYLWDGLGLQAPFNKEWKTDTVMALLRSMRESEDFSLMPILADALGDAGCGEESLLAHYRNPEAFFSLGSWIFRATGLV